MPEGCSLIVLAGNSGGGYEPYRALLPHQVYLDDIQEAFEEHPGWEVIYVIPVLSEEAFPIVFNGTYGRQRWEEKKPIKKNKYDWGLCIHCGHKTKSPIRRCSHCSKTRRSI